MKSMTIGLRQPTALLVAFALFLAFTPFRLSAASDMAQTADRAPLSKGVVAATYGKLPLSFEANQGQIDKQVKFLSRGPGYALFLTPTEAVLSLNRAKARQIKEASLVPTVFEPERKSSSARQAAVLRIRLEHANRNAKMSGIDELPGKSNYFIGNDQTKWQRAIPTFAKVKYQDVYPGVNLVYYGNQRQLEYDFVLAPGADPRQIRLSFAGAQRLLLDTVGNLIVNIANGEIVGHAPVIYQDIDGVRHRVGGSYQLRPSHAVGFKLARYDQHEPLAGCGKSVLEVPSDIAIALCDASTHAKVTE